MSSSKWITLAGNHCKLLPVTYLDCSIKCRTCESMTIVTVLKALLLSLRWHAGQAASPSGQPSSSVTHPAVAPVRLRTCELPDGVRGGGGGPQTCTTMLFMPYQMTECFHSMSRLLSLMR